MNSLLTVLDNNALVVLIYLNTEEVVEVTIHIFQIYLKIQKKNTRFSSGFEKSTYLFVIFLSIWKKTLPLRQLPNKTAPNYWTKSRQITEFYRISLINNILCTAYATIRACQWQALTFWFIFYLFSDQRYTSDNLR